MSGPQDPLNGVGQLAVITHELFLSLETAGFTETQALFLTGQWLQAAVARAS
ncbi:MAG TPA: hypothetical protein VHE33_10410 [Acidobacteriaceae bacterium]|nr:hypothetical protein [Acidobacteriaceae bacterium]